MQLTRDMIKNEMASIQAQIKNAGNIINQATQQIKDATRVVHQGQGALAAYEDVLTKMDAPKPEAGTPTAPTGDVAQGDSTGEPVVTPESQPESAPEAPAEGCSKQD